MNNRQKLVQQQYLNNEKAVLRQLKKSYTDSLVAINDTVKNLQLSIDGLQQEYDWMDDDDPQKAIVKSKIQSKIYQKQYQEQLQSQVGGILSEMQRSQFVTVSDYLDKCYEDGFIGSIFDLHGQGVPLTMPINQESMVKAVQLDSKISKGLYTKLGEDVDLLKKRITSEVTRAIATGSTYAQTAQRLAGQTNIGFNKAARIARTEGHRIQNSAADDAAHLAKDRGADVVKQWDSTLDGHTRESHVAVDGQIRELDEEFSNGLMFPGDPRGPAAEVVNCRCAYLQRARWAVGGSFTKMNNFTGQLETFDSPQDYDEFKKAFFSSENKKYMNYVEQMQGKYGTKDFRKVLDSMDDREYKHYSNLLKNNPVYNKTASVVTTSDKINISPVPLGSREMKDFTELRTYMNDTYGVQLSGRLEELDFETVQDALAGVEWSMQQFPATQGYLKKIDCKKGGVMQCTGDTIACSPAAFSGNYYRGNHEFFIRTGVHEATHMTEGYLISTKTTCTREFADVWNNHSVAKGIVKDAITKLPDDVTSGKKYWEICSMISSDASINSSECIAEAVADIYQNGENASLLSQEIFNILKKLTTQ